MDYGLLHALAASVDHSNPNTSAEGLAQVCAFVLGVLKECSQSTVDPEDLLSFVGWWCVLRSSYTFCALLIHIDCVLCVLRSCMCLWVFMGVWICYCLFGFRACLVVVCALLFCCLLVLFVSLFSHSTCHALGTRCDSRSDASWSLNNFANSQSRKSNSRIFFLLLLLMLLQHRLQHRLQRRLPFRRQKGASLSKSASRPTCLPRLSHSRPRSRSSPRPHQRPAAQCAKRRATKKKATMMAATLIAPTATATLKWPKRPTRPCLCSTQTRGRRWMWIRIRIRIPKTKSKTRLTRTTAPSLRLRLWCVCIIKCSVAYLA